MIETGLYEGEISTIFLKGTVHFEISKQDEEFNVDIKLPKPMEKVKIKVNKIWQEENSLCGTGSISIMPKAVVESKITFAESGRIKAFMKVPKLGKVVVKGIHLSN
ncbi:MAG: hypothetical protein NC122_06205 [Faecalibacterium sp.]|nr:hypothetical protein [Ruminococcus sp.]MCM1393224.1 hypothetical protein [Ruminococcus sp.]MCM1485783.1 hypothetical protein [Faecalibacterium sp.]